MSGIRLTTEFRGPKGIDLSAQFAKGGEGRAVKTVAYVGPRALAAMVRVLPAQTGLSPRVIRKALRGFSAGSGTMYAIRSRGGDISLKYFKPRETAKGVSAAPRGQRQVFASTFMKAGWWPRRVVKPNWNGQVFRRAGGVTRSGMDRFEKARSGVFIPDEMVTGASREAFDRVVNAELPPRLEADLRAVLGLT